MQKLDVGCGLKEGWHEPEDTSWIRVDPYVDDPLVTKAPADKLPYEDNSVDEIFSSHMLEHVYKIEVVPILKEWLRVLKPTGTLTLRVPDLVWCCNWWLNHPTVNWDMDVIYGNQSRPGEAHKTGFSREILVDYLREAGFNIKIFNELDTHSQRTMEFICTK